VTSYKNWPTVDVKNGKETLKRAEIFPRLTTDQLQALRKATPEAMWNLKSFATPNYLVFNPSKEQVGDKMDRKVTTDSIVADIATAQKKLGTAAGVAVYRDFMKVLPALDDDDFAKSSKAAVALDKLKGLNEAMAKEAAGAREKFETRVNERIAEIEAYVDPAAVKEDLAKLADQLKGHPLEKKIREKLKKQ